MPTPLQGKRIILGVTGSIACYKAADLASKLTQAGALVDVILTQSALEFVTPLTFQSVTGRRAFTEADLWGNEGHVQHINLGHEADLVVIAPATANTMAKLAHGIADNLLCVTALAASCPLLIAPAMDGHMFQHVATQANLNMLKERGAIIVGPAKGHLASGQEGIGRMVEPAELVGHIRLSLARYGALEGWRVVVTAGGTEEPIDPVRMITNRSSGKQGYALAQAALDLGAQVTLISGPAHITAPTGAERVDIHSAQELLQAVLERLPRTDVLLMAAAVADFRPAEPSAQKIKKDSAPPTIKLQPNPDILAMVGELRGQSQYLEVLAGFAAESQDLLKNAQVKLEKKKLDFIVANDISANDAGFSVDTNRVTIMDSEGKFISLPLLTKDEVAEHVLGHVLQLIQSRPVLHICSKAVWQAALTADEYAPESLALEGFIHFSRPHQVVSVANAYYPQATDLLLLWIDPRRLPVPLRWELVGDQLFPHLYAPLPVTAVTAALPFKADADGIFRTLPVP
jgi:phosphopantothenoylcysteine decarboxylase / phosphopantothenate---cysteine ligase